MAQCRHNAFPIVAILLLSCCSSYETLPSNLPEAGATEPEYVIGPLDNLQVFVWRNPEVSANVPVRPDGRISTPLIQDLPAAGKTPSRLARDIRDELSEYIRDPTVTVVVTQFSGALDQQVRVIGEAARPQALPYRERMTLLDVMIAVGGLTDFAAGNRAVLVRRINGREQEYRVRLADLVKDGDVTANAPVLPGDVIIVPQSWF